MNVLTIIRNSVVGLEGKTLRQLADLTGLSRTALTRFFLGESIRTSSFVHLEPFISFELMALECLRGASSENILNHSSEYESVISLSVWKSLINHLSPEEKANLLASLSEDLSESEMYISDDTPGEVSCESGRMSSLSGVKMRLILEWLN